MGAGVAVGVGGTGVGGVVVRLTSDAHAAKMNSNETMATTNLYDLINCPPNNPKSKQMQNRTVLHNDNSDKSKQNWLSVLFNL